MAGVTPEGFETRLVDEVIEDISEDVLANIDPTLDLNADAPLGQIVGIVAASDAELFDALQAVYDAAYARTATGAALDEILALTGVTRLAAAPTRTVLAISGTIGTVVNAGFTVRQESTGIDFVTRDAVTLVDDGFGVGRADVYGFANVDGPVPANQETVELIITPVAGVSSVSNDRLPETTILGRFRETDDEARTRRVQLLFASGNATVNAIRDALLRVESVTAVTIFENDTASTDGDGVPAHSFESLVSGGVDQDVFDALGLNKAAGIQAYGTTSGTYTDTAGTVHTVAFTRPTNVTLKVNVELEVDDDYPADGDAQVKQALADFIAALDVGDDVKRNLLFGAITERDDVTGEPRIPGIVDITTLQVAKTADAFDTANIVITARQKATLATSAVTVMS